MKRIVSKALICLGLFGLYACDDGRIYLETNTSAEGKTVVMEGVDRKSTRLNSSHL